MAGTKYELDKNTGIFLLAGGDIGGSVASTQIAYGSGVNTITSNSNFTYTSGTGALVLGVSGSSNSVSITGDTNGGLTLASGGTNQNITLTPSGTGQTILRNSSSHVAQVYLYDLNSLGSSSQRASFIFSDGGDNSLSIRTDFSSGTTNQINIVAGGAQNARFLQNTHLLLGGLTTDGTGVLQFPSHSTSSGGIALGTTTFIYNNSGGGTMVLGGSPGNNATLAFARNGGVAGATITHDATGLALSVGGSLGITIDNSQNTVVSKKITSYNGVTTAGYGVPIVVAAGRVTAQSAANASIATYTVGAVDGSFEVSANMNVTASTTLTTTLTCTYTDESNTARTMVLPVTALNGTMVAAGAITGAGASVWETPVIHIRCKASTAITILTSTGTFTGVTYTAEGIIKQTA